MANVDITKEDLFYHWEQEATAHATMNKMSAERYDKLEEKIDDLAALMRQNSENLKPIIEIYSNFQGFGAISKNFFKWIVVPLSVVVGIILTVINIIKYGK